MRLCCVLCVFSKHNKKKAISEISFFHIYLLLPVQTQLTPHIPQQNSYLTPSAKGTTCSFDNSLAYLRLPTHTTASHTTNTPLPLLHDDPTHTTSTTLLLPHIFFRGYYIQLDGRLLYLLLKTYIPLTPLGLLSPTTHKCPSHMLTPHISPAHYYSYHTPCSEDTTFSLTEYSLMYSCQHTHHCTTHTTPHPDPAHTTSTLPIPPHTFVQGYYIQLDGQLVYLLLPIIPHTFFQGYHMQLDNGPLTYSYQHHCHTYHSHSATPTTHLLPRIPHLV